MSENKWQLYATMPGWKRISVQLDGAMARTLAKADKAIASGKSPRVAAFQAFDSMQTYMSKSIITNFGGSDSEPREHLGYLIEQHMKKVHHVSLTVNRFGDVN